MKYGAFLPHIGPLAHGNVLEHIRTTAQTAEALGFDSVWVGDHIVTPINIASKYPYTTSGAFPLDPKEPILEPLSVLSFAAACTTTIRLGTAVLVLPHRHAVVTAKTVATLDVLSGGRVILGVGVGWMEEEFKVLNAPFSERGALSEETVAAMKELWTSENPRFAGRYYTFADLRCEPRPVQKPHPPIWVGGHLGPALRRVVEYGDGWAAVVFSPQEFAERLARLKERAAQAGRDLSTITLCVSPRGKRPEAMIDDIPKYQELGATYLYLAFFNFARSYEEMAGMMERFARDVRLI
ncbi:MAG TPA: LLM class F420-dependent oxidoreductase [Methylomirabilota bacterium]|jgi:probable F420-dependent oxidoreductase|nr:LLM class F420-dependent oxidoreductase [Methylomirabilota bacterium]